jgi:hypothetical protein
VHQSSPLRVGTRVLVALTAFSVALLTVESHGQQSRDPHLPTRSSPPPVSAFVEVEDMLLLPEQFERLFGPSRNRQQANFRVPRDPRSQWFWDFGVIPYEIAPNFSDLERQRVLSAMEEWGRTAPVTFVPRTTQTGRLLVTRDELTGNEGSPCFANVGHIFNAVARLNLGSTCSSNKGTILHELGHVLGNLHEHQRADRDGYITIDYSNVPPNLYGAFDKSSFPPLGPYDFGSIMHYWRPRLPSTCHDRRSFHDRSIKRKRHKWANGWRSPKTITTWWPDCITRRSPRVRSDHRPSRPEHASTAPTCCWRWNGCIPSI